MKERMMQYPMKVAFGFLLAFSTLLIAKPQEVVSTISQEVTFIHGSNHIRGTLYRPAKVAMQQQDYTIPAVVILGGSDRSARGTIKTSIATHFAKQGVAALTYDSPGTGESSGNAMLQSYKDRSNEAIAAFNFLRVQEGINSNQVGLLGGSQGALIALMGATQEHKVAFAIAVSGNTGLSHLDIVRYRIDKMGLESGLSQDDMQKAHVFSELFLALLAGPDVIDLDEIAKRAKQWPDKSWREFIALIRICHSGEIANHVWESLQQVIVGRKSEPWFQVAVPDLGLLERFLSLDVSQFQTFLKKGPYANGDFWKEQNVPPITDPYCPILAIWGEQDAFLPPYRSAAILQQQLSEIEDLDLTIIMVPKATHLLTLTKNTLEFVDGYPDMITDWLNKKLKR